MALELRPATRDAQYLRHPSREVEVVVSKQIVCFQPQCMIFVNSVDPSCLVGAPAVPRVSSFLPFQKGEQLTEPQPKVGRDFVPN